MFRRLLLILLALPLACSHIRVSSSQENSISPGNVYVGETDQKNSADEGVPVSLQFEGTAGQRVRFRLQTPKRELTGGGLRLARASGETVETKSEESNDDSLTLESALLPLTGDYVLKVYTGDLYFGKFGEFRLEFLPDTTPPVVDLEPGAPISGELTATDRRDLNDGPVDLFRLPLGPDQTRYTFIVRATAFSPSVWVYSNGLQRDAENRFGKGEYTDTVKGDVFVAVAAMGDEKLGPYTLEVRDSRAHEMATWPVMELGTRVDGKLEVSGPKSHADFKIRGIPGVVYVIDGRSTDFDISLLFTNNHPRFNPKFMGTMDNDGAGGTNSRLRFKFPDREEWVLRVVSNGDDAQGAYNLQFNTEDKAPPIDPADKMHMIKGVRRPVRELRKGFPLSAQLDAGTGLPKYAGRDVYMFHGTENEAVSLTLEARDFDAVVSLMQVGAKEALGAATARKGGAAAKLEATLPKPARADYLIQVEALDGKSKGPYTIELK